MSKCRVCDAGPKGQRMHKCPNSRYYLPGSDSAAEYSPKQRRSSWQEYWNGLTPDQRQQELASMDAYAAQPVEEMQHVEDDEHFPWHYTEYGVVCACGDAMDADENCLSKTRHLT